ncbi:C8orf37-like protein, putative (macronuclear) [Tetrahymena thermophila SB210]|uniref:Cilia- and flagella-associated protein 418 n=1 Tax=Tetrahymena thermophila (strain SB210) TaxID=312017 RepID=Q23E95_TETTS|nr:C8orf37-like protein, putative [Tetrahymena thermophila SB210]EAR94858.2 C8orf37-like protein, putative [Tetrahymena thermophila SB210]|eukprot:XP_001015103.2 C8orf37-like protein, putative [Tetrahymena thermophila SB210]
MNVDDLLNQLDDLDFSNMNVKQKQQGSQQKSTSATGSFQQTSYQSYDQKLTSVSNQPNTNSTLNKYNPFQEDEDYFKPTSVPTKPQTSLQKDQYISNQSYKQSSNDNNKGLGDIDDLLDILNQEDYKVQKGQTKVAQQDISQPIKQSDAPKANQKLTTCLNPYLCNGNSDYASDEFNMRKRVCNALRCSLCNIMITKLVDYKWAQDADLLFFRNNFSRKEKLITKAISDSSYSAYSCQCRGTSVNKLTTLAECNMKEWRCTGHFD